MRIVRIAVLLGALGALSACLSPLDQCLRDAGAQEQALREELAERRANLTRGYRIERRLEPVWSMQLCAAPGTGQVFGCSQWEHELRETRAPIDAEYEAERIALLERQLAREEHRAAEAAAQCRATYPAE
ncbi:MAG: hypothetical protein Kow0013_17180 [Pararhodobacter sp.]